MTNLIIRTVLLLTVFISGYTFEADAQSKKRLRELEKTEENQASEQAAAEAEAKQRHLDIQSKQTRKEMKRLKRKSKRYNQNRREPFFKKWFRRRKK